LEFRLIYWAPSNHCTGRIDAVDVGKCNRQVFLNSVSLGLSAEIAGALTGGIKKKLGNAGVAVYRLQGDVPPSLAQSARIISQERSFNIKTHQLVVANGRYVAGPIKPAKTLRYKITNSLFLRSAAAPNANCFMRHGTGCAARTKKPTKCHFSRRKNFA
jgi:diacylglycerol kinase family enzyme